MTKKLLRFELSFVVDADDEMMLEKAKRIMYQEIVDFSNTYEDFIDNVTLDPIGEFEGTNIPKFLL